jgi:hypothetical protein
MCGKKKKPEEFHGNRSNCRECNNEKTYEYRRGAGRVAHNTRMVEYNRRRYSEDSEYRLKVAARSAVKIAVVAGVLVRPSTCPQCRRKVKVHGHHHKGYDKPNWLKVKWLCARCHFKEDSAAHGVG